METYLLPFLAVVLGYFLAIIVKPAKKKTIKLLLAFSGSFLLTMTVSHLLPEVYAYVIEGNHIETTIVENDNSSHNHTHEHHDHSHDHASHDNHNHTETTNSNQHNHDHDAMKQIGLFIMLGIVFQIILEYFSKGAEHGHVHVHEKMTSMPWLLFASLCLHALFEGMPVSQHTHLAWAIAIHHFPIAIILTLFFLQAELNKKFVFMFMIVFALMTPLGTYLSANLSFLIDYYVPISAFVIGILFHISSTIIFESSEGHKFNLAKLLAIIIGIAFGFFV
ncbi:ZIP family metal transporter [Paenimyroides baculatum]|uniref:ZIP family metal transporter n=1 Tax=Paenimyroides baculatum TaxID=2608000 RepID=A0A5M6CUF6_9FLAO|nr:ZIP family metal transporter [Paenimyroides baculatum]KAA5537612.1 ZIP family metal transporter [Paenimyroides baculatum]